MGRARRVASVKALWTTGSQLLLVVHPKVSHF